MMWPQVSLGEICKPKQHKTIPKSELLDEGFVVYGANGPIGYYSDFTHDRMTIAVTCRGATCGTINIVPPKSYVTGNAMALDELDEGRVDISFLRYALEHQGFESVINGAAQPQITRTPLLKYTLPLPPLEEQKRIAAILDQADALRRLRQRAIDRLNTLGQAIFHEMFGDPLANTNIPRKQLGECVRLINGRAYKKDEERESGTPVLRIQNLNGGDRWFYSDLILPDDKYCEKGDLLFAWSATFGPYIWWGDRVIYHYHIWKIECGPNVTKEYVYWLLKLLAEDVKRGGRGISMTHATKGGMEQRLIPVPTIDEQKRFSSIINSLDHSVKSFREHSDYLGCLFSSLQAKAFRGEL